MALGNPSKRTSTIKFGFGLPAEQKEIVILNGVSVPIGAGKITLLVGPSGSGKSSALAEIQRQHATASMVHRVLFPRDLAVIDCVEPSASTHEAIALLTACGLGEAGTWVRKFDSLSDGEKFRARLARSIALQVRDGNSAPLLCDEFCSGLHRRLAKAISFNLRKIVTRTGISFVAAASNEDVIADLQPDAIVRLRGGGRAEVEERVVNSGQRLSLTKRLRIERGFKRDYEAFAAMHYRATDELGFVDKVFVLRDGPKGDVLGIVVYSHGPLELSLRNQATNGWFVRNPRRVNRHMRILRRLVIHPDMRGCGLGHMLVRRTLPPVGTKYVECLAAMGEFNPVFEKAGMNRVGQVELSARQRGAIEELATMGVRLTDVDFPAQVARSQQVRHIVARVVYEWYSATTGGGRRRVEHQSPEFLAQLFRGLVGTRPVYYLWERTKGSSKFEVQSSKTKRRSDDGKDPNPERKRRAASIGNRQSPIDNSPETPAPPPTARRRCVARRVSGGPLL